MQQKVKIVILSYNRIETLEKCIESFLSQTYKDFSLIVLDNASDVDIEGALREFNDSRISLIRNKENLGGLGNFEKAWTLVDSEYFMIFHDDDCAHPRLIETQVKILDELSDAAFIVTGCNLIYDDSKMTSFDPDAVIRYKLFDNHRALTKAYISGSFFGFCSVMYRVSKTINMDAILRKELYRRFSLCFDRPFLIAIATNNKCVYLESPTYNVRVHGGQDSKRLAAEYRYLMEVFKYYAKVLEDDFDDKTRSRFDYLVTLNMLTTYLFLLRANLSKIGFVLMDLSSQKLVPVSTFLLNGVKFIFARLCRNKITN